MRKLVLLLAAFSVYGEEQDIVQISEAMGHIIGKNLQAMGVDFDLKAVVKGWQEEMEGKSSPLNEEECVQAIAKLQALSEEDHENHPVSAPDSAEYR
jgi:hypothetical protein